jgi:two-component system sensor histidine kinase KdpD
MLNEGARRSERGTDVVIAFVETHGRQRTADQMQGLELVPRKPMGYRGSEFDEMDLDAVLSRHPQVALVDELAHTNVPGSKNEKRWQDVDELLASGIDVISTANIQHLESLNDVVEQITGVVQRETIPDSVVREADQIELVDMAPEALRRRMAHGNIYKAEKIDAALGNYFRVGNLSALRELALLWVADQVDDALEVYRDRHDITDPWETRERVVVALTGAPGGDRLIRRAARIAQRAHGELLGVHVSSATGLAGPQHDLLDRHRHLLEELGGQYRELTSTDVAAAVAGFAKAENATQVVMGASGRSRVQELIQGSVINRVVRLLGPGIDAHVISADADQDEAAIGRRKVPWLSWYRRVAPVSPRRQAWGWALTLVGLPLLTLMLASLRDDLALGTVLLLYLLFVVAIALVGGLLPALTSAVAGSLLLNWYFTEPFHRFTINEAENLFALVVFVITAVVVAALVDLSARRGLEAKRARAEAEALAGLVGQVAEEDSLPALVETLRTTFGLEGAAVLHRTDDGWDVEAASGAEPPRTPDGAAISKQVGGDMVLVLAGAPLSAEDQRVLNALVAQLALAVRTRRLLAEAGQAQELVAAGQLRTSLLQAVSHDLRTPLASIKASISSLRQPDVTWGEAAVEEFHRTIDEESDRLAALIDDLLDMSRIQAGVVEVVDVPVGLDDVVAGALGTLGGDDAEVEIRVPAALPPVQADPALLERSIANLVANACKASPAGVPVVVEAGAVAGRVDLRIADRGPGIPVGDRELVFEPFQRLTDHGQGVGLGLAISRGFIEAMGGELELEDTPGGGLTVVVRLPVGTDGRVPE